MNPRTIALTKHMFNNQIGSLVMTNAEPAIGDKIFLAGNPSEYEVIRGWKKIDKNIFVYELECSDGNMYVAELDMIELG